MHLVCLSCLGVNRVDSARLLDQPKCGKCQQPLLNGGVTAVTQAAFSKLITRTELPVVVDFWASWCGPCKMMAPTFEQVAKQFQGKAVFVKVNTESEQQLAAQFGIRSIPTLKVFKAGQVVADAAGAMSQGQLTQFVQPHV